MGERPGIENSAALDLLRQWQSEDAAYDREAWARLTGAHRHPPETVRLTIENASELSPDAIEALSAAQWWLMSRYPWLTVDVRVRGASD